MAVLKVLKGLTPGQCFPLMNERSILGRHPDCDVVLEVGAVSRHHAQIVREGLDFFVEDLNSRNGTYLNGRIVEGRALLKDNDRVKVCDLLFTFHLEDPRVSAPPPTVHDSPNVDPLEESLDEEKPEPVSPPAAPVNVELVEDDPGRKVSNIQGTLSLADSTRFRVTVRPEVKLKALIDITQNLATTLSVEEMLPKILESLFKLFVQADRGFLLLLDASGKPIPKAVLHRHQRGDESSRVSRTILNHVLEKKEAILSTNTEMDARFDAAQSIADLRIRSLVCAPLIDPEGKALGVIQLDTQNQMQRFEQEDLDVLFAVAAQAAVAIKNGQMHEALVQRQVIDRDLELAQKVQQGFLPQTPPQIPGYGFFHFYQSARQVGGDFFDYIPLPGNRLAVVLGDVSGKGVSAALLMAKLSSEIRYCLAFEQTPGAAVSRLNTSFLAAGWEDRFATFVMLVVDLNTNQLTVVNAGHMPPLLRKPSGQVVEISEETDLPLGVAPGIEYGQFVMSLGPNESLTVYTDGFSEAMNADRDLYGIERLIGRLSGTSGKVELQGQNVLKDVQQFIGKTPQSDDMCLICFGRSSS